MQFLENIDLDKYHEYGEYRAKVREKAEYKDEIGVHFENLKHGILGQKLPWTKTDQLVGLQDSEVSIWAGENGSGKSLLLGQVMMKLSTKVLIASFEMPAVKTLSRMTRQFCGHAHPSKSDIDKFSDWKQDQFFIFDHVGTVEPWQVFALCRYAHYELGINHIVIDSLMKCTKGEDDYNGQKDFVDALTVVAKETKQHIHLVHHIRKGQTDDHIPSKKDIKGSGVITDLADNVFIVARNKKKEKETEANGIPDNTIPDTWLKVEKQRNGDWEGSIALWYDRQSTQFQEGFRLPVIF